MFDFLKKLFESLFKKKEPKIPVLTQEVPPQRAEPVKESPPIIIYREIPPVIATLDSIKTEIPAEQPKSVKPVEEYHPYGRNWDAWRNFRFNPPYNNQWEENFNYLAGINPDLAYRYGFWCPGYDWAPRATYIRNALDTALGGNWSGGLVNLMNNEGLGGSQQSRSFGVPDDWSCPDVLWSGSGTMVVTSLEGKLISPMTITLPQREDFGYPAGQWDNNVMSEEYRNWCIAYRKSKGYQ